MPGTPSTIGLSGEAVQTIKLESAPTVPYVLTAVVALPVGGAGANVGAMLGVRKGATATAWWPTDKTLIARTKGFNYYEVQARVTSGTDTQLELDVLDQPQLIEDLTGRTGQDGTTAPQQNAQINADAWAILNDPGALTLQFQILNPGTGHTTHNVSLTGGFNADDSEDPTGGGGEIRRMWTSSSLSIADTGWHRWGRFIRTLYKCVPVVPGGSMGYLHIFGTVMSDTPEIQWEVNWHNGGIEERRGGLGVQPSPGSNTATPPDSFGRSRAADILFSRVQILGFANLPPADGFSGSWEMTPRLLDGSAAADSAMFVNAAGTNVQVLCRPINTANANERHVLPIGFQRSWRFAVNPDSVTPYAKRVVGMADWTQGGWMFTALGVPDLSSNPAIDLTAEANTAKSRLRMLQPYEVDGSQTQGMNPVSAFLPGSWSEYGGQTSGTGMWPYYGTKQAWTAEKDGLELLMVEQLRAHSRNYGALYYNISGHPVHPTAHAAGQSAPWRYLDQRFTKSGGVVKDQPFLIGSANENRRKVHLAAYNPGPYQNTQVDDVATPDWWVGGGVVSAPIAMDTLAAGVFLPLDHTSAPTASFDKGVQVIVQVRGANLFSALKSLPLTIVGVGEADVEVTEVVTLTGPALAFDDATYTHATKTIAKTGAFPFSSPSFNPGNTVTVVGGTGATAGVYVIATHPSADAITLTTSIGAGADGQTNIDGCAGTIPEVQAVRSSGRFKQINSITVGTIVGTLLSTETLTIGRSSVNIADYSGTNGITALDDQHSVRYFTIDKALTLLSWDTLGNLYCLMNAATARLSRWETGGLEGGQSLFETYFGGPNRGTPWTRLEAWICDRICTGMALWNGRLDTAVTEQFWRRWCDVFQRAFLNSKLANNSQWQSVRGKEYKQAPFGTSSIAGLDFNGNDEGDQVYFGFAGREAAYLLHALAMLLETKESNYTLLQSELLNSAVAYRDYLWKTAGGVGTGILNYIPHSYVTRNGSLVLGPSEQQWQPNDVWTSYTNQAALPEANPVSGCLINPAVPPAVDDDRYVGVIDFDAIVGGTPLTLLNNASDTGGPTQLRMAISAGGATYTNAKRRSFRVVGTCPKGAHVNDQLFVAETAGNTFTAAGQALTLASASPISVGGSQARKVEFTMYADSGTFLGGGTPSSPTGQWISFLVTGTSAGGSVLTETVTMIGNGTREQKKRTNNVFASVTSIHIAGLSSGQASTEKWRIGTPSRLLVAQGKGTATQAFYTHQHFATISSITMLTNAQAARTHNPDAGSVVSTEKVRFGTTEVGIYQLATTSPGLEANPLGQEAYQLAYGLAVLKHYGDLAGSSAAVDTCILRFTGTASLADAKAALETYGEYTGGPTGRLEQTAPLQWALRNA